VPKTFDVVDKEEDNARLIQEQNN